MSSRTPSRSQIIIFLAMIAAPLAPARRRQPRASNSPAKFTKSSSRSTLSRPRGIRARQRKPWLRACGPPDSAAPTCRVHARAAQGQSGRTHPRHRRAQAIMLDSRILM